MLTLIVKVDVSLDDLVGRAIKHGYLRDNPRRAWSDPEKRDAARFYARLLIEQDGKESPKPYFPSAN